MVAVVGSKFDHTKGIAIQEKGREDRVPYTQSNQDKIKIKNLNSDCNEVERISPGKHIAEKTRIRKYTARVRIICLNVSLQYP